MVGKEERSGRRDIIRKGRTKEEERWGKIERKNRNGNNKFDIGIDTNKYLFPRTILAPRRTCARASAGHRAATMTNTINDNNKEHHLKMKLAFSGNKWFASTLNRFSFRIFSADKRKADWPR